MNVRKKINPKYPLSIEIDNGDVYITYRTRESNHRDELRAVATIIYFVCGERRMGVSMK